MRTIVLNRAQCAKCGDIIISRHRHDWVHCKCGTISVDGGCWYLKRSFNKPSDVIELSSFEEESSLQNEELHKSK